MSGLLEKFLGSLNKSAQRIYARGIQVFSEWYGKDVYTILQERKDDVTPRPDESLIDAKNRASRYERILERFHKWLANDVKNEEGKVAREAYSINTARAYCMAVMQLFRYYNMPITLRNGSPISQMVVSTGDFPLEPIHVRKMFHVAKDLRSKLLISMMKDLGWGIGDIVSIKRSELPNLDAEPPIEWKRLRGKTKQLMWSFLSAETAKLLKEYLFTFPKDDPDAYLFHSNGVHITGNTVNLRLRDLVREAEIDLGNKNLHSHCFRKMIISTGKNLGIDPDIIKLLVGKSVKKDILAYMTTVNVKQAFLKLQEALGITSVLESEAETELASMGQVVSEMQAYVETLTNKLISIDHAVQVIGKFLQAKYGDLTKVSKGRALTDKEAHEEQTYEG